MIVFNVSDVETGTPLTGVILWREYQSEWVFPLIDGRCEIVSSGCFTGAERHYTIMVDGYVPREGWFLQHNGWEINVGLAKWYWFAEPEGPPMATEEVGSSLAPLAVIGGLLLLSAL